MGTDSTPGRPLRLYTSKNSYHDMSTETVVGLKINSYKDWLCGAGVENIYVDMDGKIFTASCRVGGQIGSIYENLTIPNQWVTCPKQICSCGADLFIPKAKDKSSTDLLCKTFPNKLEKNHPKKTALENETFVAMERTHDSDIKQVYWEIGRRCNYDCSYCWPFIHNKTDEHKSLQQLIRGTLLIDELFAHGQKCHYVISGGEPTLNPDLMDWLKFISSLGHSISMHSNGSRHPHYFKELIKFTNLNISVHFDFYNKEKLLKVIEAVTQVKVKALNKDVGHLEVKLMMSPGLSAIALDFEESLRRIPHFTDYCTWAIVPIRDGTKGDLIKEGYQDSDFKLFGDRIWVLS